MKLLIVHMRYHPDATGTAPLVTQLAEDLTRYGEDVIVLTSFPHYGRQDIHPDYQHFSGDFYSSQENGVEVIRTPVYLPRNTSMLQRALNYLSYNLNSIVGGVKLKEVDIILAINPPITTSFSAWVLSIVHRAPLIIGIQDIWPDCLIEVGRIRNPLMMAGSKILEKIQYKISNRIIVLSGGMKENLVNKGVAEAKIQEIPNWADPKDITPVNKINQFYLDQNLAGKFVVLFSGNHGYIAALEGVLEAAKILNDEPEILFLLAGEGSVKPELMALAERLSLDNVIFLPTQPKDRWIEMLSAADLGLVTLKSELAELNVPSKVYTLMSAACPILASVPEESEIVSLITKAECGYVVLPESPFVLADTIIRIKESPDLLEKYAQNGRKYLLEYLSREKRTSQYHHLITDLVKEGNSE